MAQIITARLSRTDAQPWGFRLQGGKDFGTPLVIQKVHTGSIADNAGLQAGDAVVRVNQTDLYNLRHKDAQDAIVKAGPSFELVVQRGGSTWKPTVTPLSSAAASPLPGNYTPVTKTSLAANMQPVSAIGTGHNSAARPFVPPSPVRSIVNKQYNSPVAMYSEETIAETLTSQAEVLAGGCLGVNFKKNEKVYNPEKSEVLKALQENDSEPEPEINLAESSSVAPYHQPPQPPQQHQHQQQIVTKHVTAPVDKPPSSNPLPPGQNICADCERLIVGVFVRIKDKNLHVECFKCATCGSSLKNQGYYNLNNKLYCDVHARLAAMNSPPPNSNGLVPVAIPPKNLGVSTISSALNAHAGNLNGNHNLIENQISPTIIVNNGTKVNDDYNNNIVYDNRSVSETDCSSLSSSDKENDSRPSSSHGNNINKSDITNGIGADGFHYRTLNGRVIKSVIPPGKGIKVNYKIPSNISGPKPFSYTQPPTQVSHVANPPMAAPKSPSSYPPPSQPTWAPPSSAPVAPKPVGPVQGGFNKKPGFKPKEFIDIEKCNGKPREEEKKKKKKEEIYVACDSEEEFDPQELVEIAKPPPSNFIWPPPTEEQKVPIAAPIYVVVPETQHITAKPCTSVKPLGRPAPRLTTQNLCTVETASTCECLNVESNITATTSSNASSESEYKMYQTQNNHYVNMFEQHEQQEQQQHDDEVEEINKKQIEIDLRKTPPQIELPKDIKVVEFVEPDPEYQPETFSNVFSKKKETWQKMTENVIVTKREEKRTHLVVEPTDDNPDNSEVDETQQEDTEVEEINVQKIEIEECQEVQHVGPHDGTYYQLAPSNIPQPVPKGYQSDLQKALVYSSEKPYSIRNMLPTPEPKFPCLDLYERAVREAEEYEATEHKEESPKKREIPKFEVKTTKEHRDFPHNEQEVRQGNTLLSSMMRTASPRHMEFIKSNIIEEIPLPDDKEAYFPPPISMVPNEPYPSINSYRTKSPFVSALTTISDRPFTPFGREIKSQLSLELPQATAPKSTFSNALHTAPEESFDPSSLEYEYIENNPIEYTAKVYERITVEATADDDETTVTNYSHVESYPSMCQQPYQRDFLPKIQPWSTPSEHVPENTYRNSISSCHESVECLVSDSRRCSEVANEPCCVKKNISDLLKIDEPEEEFDPDKPCPNAPYPRRSLPSPFEGMQVKITNKMTSGLHKPDEIPQYQRKWFNLPTQNPPKTPEPEELRENVPIAFKEWHETKQIIASQSESTQRKEIRVTFAEKPPIPHDTPANSRRGSVSEKIQWMEQTKSKTEEEVKFPQKSKQENLFPTKTITIIDEERYGDEDNDELTELRFPTRSPVPPAEGAFPTKGIRKNSIADLKENQNRMFERQKSLKHELEMQQQRMQHKHKVRQQKELENMQKNIEKSVHETIGEEIQQNNKLSAYEQEQEYKRQLELEKEQRQKEKALKEQQARELEYQRQIEEKRLQEIRFQEKRERDLQIQAQREAEYRKQREEQEEYLRIQQEQRDLEMRLEQEEIEKEILRQQEHERREAEKREAIRLFEARQKEEKDRELARIEAELREKREQELKKLEQEIREKREQRQREEKEAEMKRQQERKAREEAEREAKRLEEEAIRERKERERQLQKELKLRQKQDADRKQREEMELFNIEEERKRNEEIAMKSKAYQTTTYQQQMVWPPSTSTTPALNQQQQVQKSIPIIRTDSETELNAPKFHFEPLDEEQKRFMAGIRPPSTCYSPPTDEKPYPSIPYYQQHLAFYETAPDHCGIFDPRSVSPSRFSNRSRSPAFGPPPNPLRAFINKERDPVVDESGIYLCGERLLSPVWYEKGNKKIPPPVQRRIHSHNPSAPNPPPKPDLEAIKESIKHKKQHDIGTTKPPPTPPPMPKISYKATLPAVKNEAPEIKEKTIPITNNTKESMIATDLLKESVDRLNINSQNADFRKNASNVLAAMLDARMKKKVQPQSGKFDDPEFLPPPPPLPSTKPPLCNNSDQDLPLPPPPSPCKIPLSILTPPLSSDENDLPQKKCYNNKNNNNNNNNTEKVNYRHKKHHQTNNQSPDSSPSSSTSSFHGISKPELSTHARDRRSYIEKNNNNTNGNHFSGNEISFNNSVDKDTLDTIANGLANGQHPVCDKCKCKITRGPFVTALGKTWCPAHFLCVNQNCRRELMDIGFVEEKGDLYCEYCFEQFLAPPCSKCNGKIKGDCLNAIGKKFHPDCFKCTYCGKLFGNNPFFLEEGEAYCEADWNELFTTKCFACGFPVEAGDRWVEALNNNYHSQCFNCTYCKKNLEGQSFFAKGGRPFCKNHAR